jgi:hypothetical protein
MPLHHVDSQVSLLANYCWLSSQDDNHEGLPNDDDDEFIAMLLAHDDNHPSMQALGFVRGDKGNNDELLSKVSLSSVRDLVDLSSTNKRRKVLDSSDHVEDVGPLPRPVQRPLRNTPVCKFLNYLGTRCELQQQLQQSNDDVAPCVKAFISTPLCQPTLAPTPTILFPVCPCKLKHVCHGGNNVISPPILQLLAAVTNIGNRVTIAGTLKQGRDDDLEDENLEDNSQMPTDTCHP